MSNLVQMWLRKDPAKTVTYRCRTHGLIGADIVILQGNNTAPASGPLCHRCYADWLSKKFGVKEA